MGTEMQVQNQGQGCNDPSPARPRAAMVQLLPGCYLLPFCHGSKGKCLCLQGARMPVLREEDVFSS